ncbi:nicotinamide-nucleotide amidase [Sinosporangium album]|uniref:Nicotinamide-nucleotide amidase n=1 Tax=Sinosporangium album TaxID=504805 RepID=A0A1G7RZ92_9ACTN|nr:nicotinamide-nucleotide amidohydrolase family protein [Sinosporangium album]SDG15549.1 nicotinamide-nucleotide amidase [Sinosporangium album]
MSEVPAARVIALLGVRGGTLAVAESLTGGLIGARLTEVPGASAVFVGGVISYATGLKERLLGVPAALLAREGAVHPEVASAMASGVRDLCGAEYGLAVTGVAGPEPQDGRPVGTVHIAVSGPSGISRVDTVFNGSREHIRNATVEVAFDLLARVLQGNAGEQSG